MLNFQSEIRAMNKIYKLKAIVRCHGYHFSCAVLDGCWKFIDDMTENCRYFTSLDELYLNVTWGRFFGIYILSENAETLLNCETILGSSTTQVEPNVGVVNCFGKEKLDPGVSDRKEYQKKYYSANKEVLKQKARERYDKKNVLSSEKEFLI